MALVNSTEYPRWHACIPRAVTSCDLPNPTPPTNTTLAASSTKQSRNRFWTWSRLIFFGQVQSNDSRVFFTGNRARRMHRSTERSRRRLALPVDELFEDGEVVPLLLGSALDDVGVVLAEERELELVELCVEGVEVGLGLSACHRGSWVAERKVGFGKIEVEQVGAPDQMQRRGLGEGSRSRFEQVGDVVGGERTALERIVKGAGGGLGAVDQTGGSACGARTRSEANGTWCAWH